MLESMSRVLRLQRSPRAQTNSGLLELRPTYFLALPFIAAHASRTALPSVRVAVL
jgi:hypothetical protein